jgi:riboflavin biosynthesis pyrimidine reductase
VPVPTIRAGVEGVDLAAALVQLDAEVVLCEGGSTLNGQLVVDDLVDEICLTISPTVIAGESKRIVTYPREVVASMRLAHLLEEDGFLFCRYVRS